MEPSKNTEKSERTIGKEESNNKGRAQLPPDSPVGAASAAARQPSPFQQSSGDSKLPATEWGYRPEQPEDQETYVYPGLVYALEGISTEQMPLFVRENDSQLTFPEKVR